jgi:hypothetical protein
MNARHDEEELMRTVLLALVAAGGIGLAALSTTTSAAPVNGVVLSGQTASDSPVVNVRHCRYSRWRWRCHHWRWSRRW